MMVRGLNTMLVTNTDFGEVSLRKRLQKSTHDVHEQLNQWPLVSILITGAANVEHYAGFLRHTFNYRSACEAALSAFKSELQDIVDLHKYEYAPLLRLDLNCFVQSDETKFLGDATTANFAYANSYQALGGLYVLAGSSNGNRQIFKAMSSQIDEEKWPCQYLSRSTDAREWRSFCECLEEFKDSGEPEDQIVQGARNTFAAIAEIIL